MTEKIGVFPPKPVKPSKSPKPTAAGEQPQTPSRQPLLNAQTATAVLALAALIIGIVSLVTPGRQGDIGQQGLQGIQGVAGPQGLVGPRGEQGIQGIRGEEGKQGIQGDVTAAGTYLPTTIYTSANTVTKGTAVTVYGSGFTLANDEVTIKLRDSGNTDIELGYATVNPDYGTFSISITIPATAGTATIEAWYGGKLSATYPITIQ